MFHNIYDILYTHKCELPPEDDIVVKYIDSGIGVFCRRKMKRLLIVNQNSRRSLAFLKSRTAIRYEQQRNLEFYYFTIHPFSAFRRTWEEVMVVLLIITLAIMPLQVASLLLFQKLQYFWMVIDLIFLFDTVLTFFTGYLSGQTRKIILDKKYIALHYLKTFFFFDLISCLNISLIMYIIQNFNYSWTIRLIIFTKLLRIASLLIYMERIRENWQISVYKFKIVVLILIPLISLLWFGAAFFMIGYIHEEKWLPKRERSSLRGFLVCFYRSINCFFLLGVTRSQYEISMIVEMISMTIGLTFYLFVMAQILQIVNKYNSSSNKYYQITQEMGEFMKYKRLPESLRSRMLEYFLFRFQKNFYKESEIMSTISVELQEAVATHLCKTALEQVPIFKDLPPQLMVKLVLAMKSETYLPCDIIVSAGSPADCMFFIIAGTVAIYTSYGKEVAHLVDGSYFGEIALVLEAEKRVATVQAVEPCELYNLSRKDFLKAMQPYPEFFERIRKMSQGRLQKTLVEISKLDTFPKNTVQQALLEKYRDKLIMSQS